MSASAQSSNGSTAAPSHLTFTRRHLVFRRSNYTALDHTVFLVHYIFVLLNLFVDDCLSCSAMEKGPVHVVKGTIHICSLQFIMCMYKYLCKAFDVISLRTYMHALQIFLALSLQLQEGSLVL